jgi:alcohol dehydrogenase
VQVGLLLADHARTPLPMDRVVAWELDVLGHEVGDGVLI